MAQCSAMQTPKLASLPFTNSRTNGKHTCKMPIAVLDAGAGKVIRSETLPFLSLEAVRKKHPFTLSSAHRPRQARTICSTTKRATPAFSQSYRKISCSATWFLTVYSCNIILQLLFWGQVLWRLWRPWAGNSWGNFESKTKWQSASWSVFLGKLCFTANSVLTHWL